jgi:hypothetical protein
MQVRFLSRVHEKEEGMTTKRESSPEGFRFLILIILVLAVLLWSRRYDQGVYRWLSAWHGVSAGHFLTALGIGVAGMMIILLPGRRR